VESEGGGKLVVNVVEVVVPAATTLGGAGQRFARATTRWFRYIQCKRARKESFPPDISAIMSWPWDFF
jgi:hypothetical protein